MKELKTCQVRVRETTKDNRFAQAGRLEAETHLNVPAL
jgi:hypothetical protein